MPPEADRRVQLGQVVEPVQEIVLELLVVKVRMGSAHAESALLINERAVGTDQSKKFVMVVGADNKVAYREVSLGAAAEGLRVVTTGLKPGERIVVNGLQRVRPGALVAPEPMKMVQR